MIYFTAGAEFVWQTQSVIQTYSQAALMTAYQFVTGSRPSSHMSYILNTLNDRPTIVDSGMFTIQGQVWPSGGPQGRTDLNFRSSAWMRKYVDRYVTLLTRMNYKGLVVECDCHALTKDWEQDLVYAREQLHAAFGDRVIYVWSPAVDKPSALSDMADKYKRVSISEPAIKATMGNPVSKIQKLVKESGISSDHHLHILGTSNFRYAALPDNFSIDASTWSMIVRFGRAFPSSPFGVYWWRRKKLQAPPAVLEAVEAKFEECRRNARLSPLNRNKSQDDGYLKALAAALVASQFLVRSQEKKYQHPANDIITGASSSWVTEASGTKGQAVRTSKQRAAKR